MKNTKGFTLIELMIAVAIIGILALVLIPKVSSMKTQAKLAGLDTNLRVGQAAAEAIISDYTTDSASLTLLESALATRLGAVQNPLTSLTGVESQADEATLRTNFAGQAYGYIASADEAGASDVAAIGTHVEYAGGILYDAYVVGTTVTVSLVPFDDTGAPITAKIKTVSK